MIIPGIPINTRTDTASEATITSKTVTLGTGSTLRLAELMAPFYAPPTPTQTPKPLHILSPQPHLTFCTVGLGPCSMNYTFVVLENCSWD